MARVTSSRDRSTRTRTQPVTSSQRRPVRQRNSNATVTNSSSRGSNSGSARVTRNQEGRRPPAPTTGRTDNVRVGPRSSGRAIPPAGGTNANSPRSQNQQAWTRDRGARAQLGRALQTGAQVFARATGIDAQAQAQARLNRAAAGTRGEGVREGRPRPEITRSNSGRATDGRIQPVSVRDVTNTPRGTRPRLTDGGRPALPPGRQGGATTTSRGGAVATRPEPRPRPGGRVVVDESPRLPAGRQGGAVTTSQGGSAVRSPGGAVSRSGVAGRLANTASAAGRSGAGRALGRAGLVGLALGAIQAGLASTDTKEGANVRRSMQEEQDFKNGIIKRWTGKGERPAASKPPVQLGRTGRGGSSQDLPLRGKAGPAVPSRLLRLAQQQGDDRPTPPPTTRSTRSAASGSGSTGSYRPAAPWSPRSPQRPAAAPSSGQSGNARTWDQFNPGRGTSRTNNPLIKKDDWLMGRINQREQASADAAVNEGRASRARYNVQASPAEYNVSEEEGKKRLKIAEEERRKKKEQQAN